LSSPFATSLDRLSHSVNRYVEIAVGLLVGLTVAITFVQVVFRYGLDSSLSWSEEAARYCFIWTIFLGVSVAARRGQHIVVEALVETFPARAKRVLALAAAVTGIGFFGVFAYLTWLLVDNAWHQTSTALQIPIALVYACAPVGAALTIVHLANAALRLIAGTVEAPPKEPTA
jgi:TRAP-type C4-dicarboxylate transport system permease small subunit